MFCVQASNTASGVKTPLVLSPLAARATLRRNNLLPSPPHQQALPFLDANPGRVRWAQFHGPAQPFDLAYRPFIRRLIKSETSAHDSSIWG
jgi:hypothetical protein